MQSKPWFALATPAPQRQLNQFQSFLQLDATAPAEMKRDGMRSAIGDGIDDILEFWVLSLSDDDVNVNLVT